MPRDDISKDLIHWIKGDTYEEAFETLLSIIDEQRLVGGTGYIKGSYACVCFTEAPESKFHLIEGKYKPFGIRISKNWLFGLGGRPAIYQRENEFYQLPENIRWRHVTYEPNRKPPIDFTWEREWRIQIDELELPDTEIVIVVPDSSWIDEIEESHYRSEHYRIRYESVVYGEMIGLGGPRPFTLRCSPLND